MNLKKMLLIVGWVVVFTLISPVSQVFLKFSPSSDETKVVGLGIRKVMIYMQLSSLQRVSFIKIGVA